MSTCGLSTWQMRMTHHLVLKSLSLITKLNRFSFFSGIICQETNSTSTGDVLTESVSEEGDILQ